MAESPDIEPDREDPVLVRPYVKSVAEHERPPGETSWPEAASLPEAPPPTGAEDDTAFVPVIPGAPGRPGVLGLAPRLLILGGGVLLALAVVGYLVFAPGGPEVRRPSSVLPPALAASVPAAAPSGSASASASPSASPSPSASTSTTASAAVPAVPSASASPPPPSSAPAPGPPATDRTGAITAAGGRCLALGGLLGIDGSPIQMAGCMNVSAQRFTLATDGTLRVGGKCARATDDASVRVGGCDDQPAGQWRGGAGGTLVNSASGQCLTDPGRVAANVKVAACGGQAEQSWTLP